jgi:transposase
MKFCFFLFYFLTFLAATENLPPGHIRHVILHCFKKIYSAPICETEINDAYGEESVSLKTIQRWYRRFKINDFSLEDQPRSGRPNDFDETALVNRIREDNKQTSRDLATQLQCEHTTIENHLHAMGYTSKFGTWVPHDLTDHMKWQRLSVSVALLTRHHRRSFLPHLITGDEKWVLYVNYRRPNSGLLREKNQVPNPSPNSTK